MIDIAMTVVGIKVAGKVIKIVKNNFDCEPSVSGGISVITGMPDAVAGMNCKGKKNKKNNS